MDEKNFEKRIQFSSEDEQKALKSLEREEILVFLNEASGGRKENILDNESFYLTPLEHALIGSTWPGLGFHPNLPLVYIYKTNLARSESGLTQSEETKKVLEDINSQRKEYFRQDVVSFVVPISIISDSKFLQSRSKEPGADIKILIKLDFRLKPLTIENIKNENIDSEPTFEFSNVRDSKTGYSFSEACVKAIYDYYIKEISERQNRERQNLGDRWERSNKLSEENK